MKVEVKNHRPFLEFELLGRGREIIKQKFLLDTGCMASIVFPVAPNSFSDVIFSSIKVLPEDKWVIVADGSRVETYTARVSLRVDKSFRTVKVMIMASKEETEPIIGMEFLEYYQRKLVMDFRLDKFKLD